MKRDEISIRLFEHDVQVLFDKLPKEYCAFVSYYNKTTGIGNHIGCEACTFELMISRAVTGDIIHDDGRPLGIVPVRANIMPIRHDEKEIRH